MPHELIFMDLSLRGLSGLELLKAIQIDTVSVRRWIWLKGDSQVLCHLADMIRTLQVFAKKIFLTDVRLPAITVIVLLFFALVDRIPDKPSLFKEGGLRSVQSLHIPAGFGEPGIAANVRFLKHYHFRANSRLHRKLPPQIVRSFDSITGRSLAADLSPPHS